MRLREEHVTVERHPVNRPATAADLEAAKERTIEMTETVEEPVVSKSARVVEEVTVHKEAGSTRRRCGTRCGARTWRSNRGLAGQGRAGLRDVCGRVPATSPHDVCQQRHGL